MEMKTIEQKAKAYDEALALLVDCVPDEDGLVHVRPHEIFPELKESEDEKIRKDIIGYLQYSMAFDKSFLDEKYNWSQKDCSKWIDWLEKQNTDISSFPKEQQVFMGKYVSFDKITLIKLLAERDANNAEIIESFEKQDEQKPVNKKEEIDNLHNYLYGEQKPTQEVEHIPIFRIGDILKKKSKDYTFRIDRIEGGYYHCDRNYGAFFPIEEQGNWELVEQNSWSEEDETALSDALWCCKQAASIVKDENDMGNVWYAENWLKSIKDRAQSKQKQEWSEEDKANLLDVKCIIDEVWENQLVSEELGHSGEELESLWHWLNNLWERVEYPQPNWKPSDEQMEALWEVYKGGKEQASLATLYSDLKKLRKE